MSNSNNAKLSRDSGTPFIVDSPINVTEENLWKNDFANRKPFAEMFTKIIGEIGVEKPAVILLDGEWGSGKTYFLQSLRYELNSKGHKAIYFDAFAEDFSADPLLAICGQLSKELGTGTRKLKKVLTGFLALAGKEALRYHGINTDMIEGIYSAGKGGFLPIAEYSKSRENLENLKKELSSIVMASQAPPKGKKSEVKPLVFIIDELDRCRPTFSLELLERVKHLFQVSGVIFVFGANKESLMKSVQSEYGDQEDEYLQKFFDFDLKLPNAPSSVLAKQYIDKFKYELLGNSGRKINIKDAGIIIDELYYPLMDIMDVTLRQMQRSVQMFSMFMLISAEKGKAQRWDKVGMAACLTLLKVKYPKLYADIAYKKGECSDVIAKISPMFDKWDDFNANAGFVYSGYSHYSDPVTVSQRCRLFFNRSISALAEGDEKQIIEGVYRKDNKFGIPDKECWGWVQSHMSDRSEIVRMLENLDCRPQFSAVAE